MTRIISLQLFLIFFLISPTYSQDIIIKDIDIIPMTSNTLIKKQSVLIQDGKIKQIGKFSQLTKNQQTKIIDGKGKFLMPGLTDMHVHLPEMEKVEKALLSNVATGITQIRIMNSANSQTEIREKVKTTAPNIYYSQLIKRNQTFTESQADSLIQKVKDDKIDFVKLMSLSNESTFENLTKAAVYIGKEFWHRLTGKDSFYYDLIESIGEVAHEVDGTNRLNEAIEKLTEEITLKFPS